MALFAVTTFVVFSFGLDRTSLDGSLAAGVLLVTVLFAAILAINRLFVAERDEGGFDAMRLAPIDLGAVRGQGVGLLVYLLVLEAIALPVFAAFFLDDAGRLAAARRRARARRPRAGGHRRRGLDDRRPFPARATC